MELCSDSWIDPFFPAELEPATEHAQSHQRSVNCSKKEASTDLKDGDIAWASAWSWAWSQLACGVACYPGAAKIGLLEYTIEIPLTIQVCSPTLYLCPLTFLPDLILAAKVPEFPAGDQSKDKVGGSADCWPLSKNYWLGTWYNLLKGLRLIINSKGSGSDKQQGLPSQDSFLLSNPSS